MTDPAAETGGAADAARETGTVLDRIVADRRLRLAEDRRARPEALLTDRAAARPAPVGFAERLRVGRSASPAGAQLRLIAEIKRASPSRGVIDADLDAASQAREYADAGASGVSVLTEPTFFGGSIEDLAAAADAFGANADRPALLRKDFVFDPYQVAEARAHGADAVLLIVMMLEPTALTDLIALIEDHGMGALVEVHDEDEVGAAIDAGARVLGVNNRDLRTFDEDLGTFERLAPLALDAAAGATLVAESAIAHAADARRMADAGAHALLVGEALVRTGNIPAKARELMLVPAAQRAGAP
ncbi:MAG: indole-3-glycerol phosphate synthase TrpC [Chloroflexi bacterium]|nr:indole-3-glycerol phosphate synthase TrpC [Chloroflexota bacterium]